MKQSGEMWLYPVKFVMEITVGKIVKDNFLGCKTEFLDTTLAQRCQYPKI